MQKGEFDTVYEVGLMAIDGRDGSYCGAQYNYEYLCNPNVHLTCAKNIYSERMSFGYWK